MAQDMFEAQGRFKTPRPLGVGNTVQLAELMKLSYLWVNGLSAALWLCALCGFG